MRLFEMLFKILRDIVIAIGLVAVWIVCSILGFAGIGLLLSLGITSIIIDTIHSKSGGKQ